jgi:cytidylate kinase
MITIVIKEEGVVAIITISRGTFSGGRDLAECVAAKLGYRCIPRVVSYEAAKRYGVSDEELTKAISELPGLLDRMGSERARYIACLRAALVSEVKTDNVVYHGLAGHFLLQGIPNVLRVRVIADIEFRIKGAMERTRLTKREAIEYIKKADEKRSRWTKFLYHVDWHDPSLYDIIINLEHIDLHSACDILCHAVTLDEFKTTPEWRKEMDDLVLSTEVRAIIAVNKSVTDSGLEVSADAGTVTLSGTAGSMQDADKIREIARGVRGVKAVNSKMQVKSSW